MRDIDIQIKKARLIGFAVDFKEDDSIPTVRATLGLYTENGKKISDFTISNDWYGSKVDFPAEILRGINDMASIIEKVAHNKCNGEIGLLGSKITEKKKKVIVQEDIRIEDIPF